MPPSNVHARSHSLLLLQKLLNLRDGASPFTLLLDNLEQNAHPLLSEFITRAKISKAKVLFLSFATLKRPYGVDAFIKATGKDLQAVRAEVTAQYPTHTPSASKGKPAQRAILVIDSLNDLASIAPQSLAIFLTSILAPNVSLISIYHTDVPVILPRAWNEYEPHPFSILCYLATAILKVFNLQQEIKRQRARNRSLAEPEWGLKEDREGVLVGLTEQRKDEDRGGTVLEMDLRRRSGRTTSEKFILQPSLSGPGKLSLLTDHPMFAAPTEEGADGKKDGEPESTFDLGLTEKQRKDREGIILPYFDAQSDIGAGEGGRILYEMGREDDFDEEDDEI